ncbi:MAG: response regulator [Vulcanimicrobiota bacterium]
MTSITTILIVDDEPGGREALEGLLSGQGYVLAFAVNGSEAISRADALQPDLILLDVMMPDMDGFEVCRRLRANELLAEVPIVLLTALDDQDSRLSGIEAGADDFISKPYNRAELRARIKTITRLNRYRRLLIEREQAEWVLERSGEGFLIIGSDDRILYANVKARLYLGIIGEVGEPVEKTFLQLAMESFRCEPAELWEGWPSTAVLARAEKRYLVREETSEREACWLEVSFFERALGENAQWLIRIREITQEVKARRFSLVMKRLVFFRLRKALGNIRKELQAHSSLQGEGDCSRSAAEICERVENLERELGAINLYLDAPVLAKRGQGFSMNEFKALLKKLADDMGIEYMTVTVDDEVEELMVSLTETAFEMIFWEILDNSRKFHPEKKPMIMIKASCNEQNGLIISVCDDGVNIPSYRLARVWMPYYRGDKAQAEADGGEGLGLSLVSSLIWQTGGSCRLYNREEDPGVIFECSIPQAGR